MAKRLILLIIAYMLCSCNITHVTVEKKVYIIGNGNYITITGSELKDNQASQSADGELEVPVVP